MPNAKQNLVIVESPSKAKTIGKYLGPDYQVKASMGHLRDLAKSTLSVDIEQSLSRNTIRSRARKRSSRSCRRPQSTPTASISRLTRTAKARPSPGT